MRNLTIVGNKTCEMCDFYDVEEPGKSVKEIWLHAAFGNTECRYVAICQDCFEQGAHDDIDPNCKNCNK